MSKPLSGRVPAATLTVAIVLLSGSCDKNRFPMEPTPVPGPRSTGPIAFVSDRDGTEAVYLANEDASVVTRLSDGRSPAWSSDGRKIALHRARDLYVINVDGSGLQRVVVDGWEPDWSPDGRLIVFRDSSFSISVVDVTGSSRRTLHDTENTAVGPAWSPDGQRIVFAVSTYILWFPVLWTMNADGSGLEYIAVYDGRAPAWSPDGSQIAFISAAGIGIVSPDGSSQRLQVTGNVADVGWTPDGRLIYTRPAGGSLGGRIFINDGGAERQLIPEATAPRAGYFDMEAVWRK